MFLAAVSVFTLVVAFVSLAARQSRRRLGS
jgi:hypothetical protein